MGQEEVTKEVSDRKSPHNLENTMDNRVTEAAAEPMSEDAWNLEKDELLKTHPGWFAAYQDGKRVALQPSLDRLAAALDKKLGSPRRPCEFYEIIGKPMIERGPSPRLRPARAEKQGVNNGKNSAKG